MWCASARSFCRCCLGSRSESRLPQRRRTARGRFLLRRDSNGSTATTSSPASSSFMRRDPRNQDNIVVICNMTPMPRQNYIVGVPRSGFWQEVLNSDAPIYGGSGVGNFGGVQAAPHRCTRAISLAHHRLAAAGGGDNEELRLMAKSRAGVRSRGKISREMNMLQPRNEEGRARVHALARHRTDGARRRTAATDSSSSPGWPTRTIDLNSAISGTRSPRRTSIPRATAA